MVGVWLTSEDFKTAGAFLPPPNCVQSVLWVIHDCSDIFFSSTVSSKLTFGHHENSSTLHKNLTNITDRLLRAEITTLAQQGACYYLLITGPKYVTQEPPSIFTSIRIIDLTIRPLFVHYSPAIVDKSNRD